MNTYTFRINAVDVHTQVGDLEKVVYNVHWSYIAEDEDGNHSLYYWGAISKRT